MLPGKSAGWPEAGGASLSDETLNRSLAPRAKAIMGMKFSNRYYAVDCSIQPAELDLAARIPWLSLVPIEPASDTALRVPCEATKWTLFQFQLRNGNSEQSLQELKRRLLLEPKNPHLHYELGHRYEEQSLREGQCRVSDGTEPRSEI